MAPLRTLALILNASLLPILSSATPLPQNVPAAAAPPATPGLKGPPDFLGYSPNNPISKEDTRKIAFQYAQGQQDDPNMGEYLDFTNIENPQPIRGSKGGTDPGPRNQALDKLNSDKLAPPTTDKGQTINAQWPMGLSHTKMGLKSAGWSKQQNLNVMPDAKKMAGVDMRLEAGGYRELHWHLASEWALVMNGSCRIQAVDENGQTFTDDVSKGDVWFFPPGVPHSIQALDGGVEFLLVFDDGNFSEDNTFLASEIFAHNPKSVLAKNFGVSTSSFQDIPDGELFIFPGTPAPKDIAAQNITGPDGIIPKKFTYSYHWSMQEPMQVAGGSVKVLDPTTFPIAAKFSSALVTVKPGAMREIHWHPLSDEWSFFLSGTARATLFAAPNVATTFDYRAGDVAYFPQSHSHYVENVGKDDVVFLEVLQQDHFSDIALGQWLALTPPQIVKDTLHLSDETLAKFSKTKQYVVAGTPPAPGNGTRSSPTSSTSPRPTNRASQVQLNG